MSKPNEAVQPLANALAGVPWRRLWDVYQAKLVEEADIRKRLEERLAAHREKGTLVSADFNVVRDRQTRDRLQEEIAYLGDELRQARPDVAAIAAEMLGAHPIKLAEQRQGKRAEIDSIKADMKARLLRLADLRAQHERVIQAAEATIRAAEPSERARLEQPETDCQFLTMLLGAG